MVQLGMPQAILAAMKQGKIAGANIGSPYPANAVSDGYAQYLFRAPLAEIPPMSTAVTQTLATTESYYNGHRDLIKKFLAGYQKGLDAMKKDPDGTAQVVATKYFPDQPNFMSSFKDDLPIIAKGPADHARAAQRAQADRRGRRRERAVELGRVLRHPLTAGPAQEVRERIQPARGE